MFRLARVEVRAAFWRARQRRKYFSDFSATRFLLLDIGNALRAQFKWKRRLPSMPITFRGNRGSLRVRTHASDLDAVRQIFAEKEYGPFDSLKNVSTIIDLGANIGCASVYFLSLFRTARVIAVEPDPRNFEVCRRNLARYRKQATVLEGAIWSRRGDVALLQGVYKDKREWATQVSAPVAGKPSVKGYVMADLLDMLGDLPVDILKIDIERSELELFGAGELNWLDRVRNIAIELHDKECEAVFFRALSGYKYDCSRSGELTLVKNLTRLPA